MVTVFFIFLERRNEELVHLAEDVLRWVEKDVLFKHFAREITWPHQRTWLGVMKGESITKPLGIFIRQDDDENKKCTSKYLHGKWLPLIQLAIACTYIFLLLYSVYSILNEPAGPFVLVSPVVLAWWLNTVNGVSGVIFDVDGVLLDSLEPHLQICRDKNREYGLGLAIPNADEFRKIVRRGVKISPMKFFFQAVGFPSEYADRAVEQYNMTFVRRYTIRLFPGVNEMLHHLASAGLSLGIVTSNVRANIESALGSNMRLFRPDCIFTKDTADWDSKVYALLTAAARLNVDTNKTMYVGDQPADWFAAKEAGAKFLGVSYGWGLSQEDKEFPIINNAFEIAAYILNSLGN